MNLLENRVSDQNYQAKTGQWLDKKDNAGHLTVQILRAPNNSGVMARMKPLVIKEGRVQAESVRAGSGKPARQNHTYSSDIVIRESVKSTGT